MKKTIVKILAIMLIGGTIIGITGCRNTTPNQDIYVDYYGCPNSKKIKKLNVKKRG